MVKVDVYESQIHSIFQSVFKYSQVFSGTMNKTFGWKSKMLSVEGITTPTSSDNSLLQNLLIFIISK